MPYNEDNGMTTIGLPTIMYADLRRHFSFVAAWSAYMGSLTRYTQEQIDLAARDNAPDDVVFCTDWLTWLRAMHVKLTDCERNGWVYIVRDDAGKPVRVWTRAEGLRLTTSMIGEMASRIRQTGSPWSPDVDADDELPAMDGTNTI